MHVGGKAPSTEMTDREKEICARIGPSLKESAASSSSAST
jgi:glutathione synthase